MDPEQDWIAINLARRDRERNGSSEMPEPWLSVRRASLAEDHARRASEERRTIILLMAAVLAWGILMGSALTFWIVGGH